MTPTDRDAGRALLVDRARAARTALLRARTAQDRGELGPTDSERACAALTRFTAGTSELAVTDRLARRAAQVWLDAVRAHLLFGTAECGDAETVAFDALARLPDGGCSRRALRQARRSHRAGLRRWHARHSRAIGTLVGRLQP